MLHLLFNMSSTCQKPLLLKVFIGDVPLTEFNAFASGTSLSPFRWRFPVQPHYGYLSGSCRPICVCHQ